MQIMAGSKVPGKGVQIYKGQFVLIILLEFFKLEYPHENEFIWSQNGGGGAVRFVNFT